MTVPETLLRVWLRVQATIVSPCESMLVPFQLPAKLTDSEGADGDLAHEIASAVRNAVETTRSVDFMGLRIWVRDYHLRVAANKFFDRSASSPASSAQTPYDRQHQLPVLVLERDPRIHLKPVSESHAGADGLRPSR